MRMVNETSHTRTSEPRSVVAAMPGRAELAAAFAAMGLIVLIALATLPPLHW